MSILQPHQKRVEEKMKESNRHGLLIYHPLGSGKTLTALNASNALGADTDVVVPAATRKNFTEEIKKWKYNPSQFHLKSYEKFIKDSVTEENVDHGNQVLIIDEAHRLKNKSALRTQIAKEKAKEYNKVMLLTGTPIQNKPSDIAPLINIAANQNLLPEDETLFNQTFLQTKTIVPSWNERLFKNARPYEIVEPKNMEIFKSKVHGLVDYHNNTNRDGFPDVSEQEVFIPLSDRQKTLYKYLYNDVDPVLKWKIQNSLPPSKQESTSLNSYLQAARQISNTPVKFSQDRISPSPKIDAVFNNIVKTKGPTVVYSNYLDSGLMPLAERLSQSKIPASLFTGGLSDKKRAQIVSNYNSGKTKVLLLSSAGGEGLDLKNTSNVHILEPHWHEPKIDQVIGRTARYKSHAKLNPEDRKVDVFKYYSVFPNNELNTADVYLKNLGKRKQQLNETFLEALKEEGSND